MVKSRNKKLTDGIDEERFEGIFLPPEMHMNRSKERNLKGFLLENIEIMLDEIIDDFSDRGKN